MAEKRKKQIRVISWAFGMVLLLALNCAFAFGWVAYHHVNGIDWEMSAVFVRFALAFIGGASVISVWMLSGTVFDFAVDYIVSRIERKEELERIERFKPVSTAGLRMRFAYSSPDDPECIEFYLELKRRGYFDKEGMHGGSQG